jgi:methylisocitrate lyase
MNAAARRAYEAIRRCGSQSSIVDSLQTRDELYQLLNYYAAEEKIDRQRTKP